MTITDTNARKMKPGDPAMLDDKVVGLKLASGSTKGHGKWSIRFVSPVSGKRREMGLGTYPEIGVADARERGSEQRKVLAKGLDPIEERRRTDQARKSLADVWTFRRAAEQVHSELKSGWKNTKHIDQWINTLRTYVFPTIGERSVDTLKPSDFADAIRPIWMTKPETAARVKQRCETILEWCWAKELVQSNPASRADKILKAQPSKSERVIHQPAMDWREIPDFVAKTLRSEKPDRTRPALEFLILTAARSGEVRGMRWAEVDLNKGVWTIPRIRMKAKLPHSVPLAARALQILEAQRTVAPDELVFPAPRGKALTDMAFTAFLRHHEIDSTEAGRVATAHGMRSSFRDWASQNGYTRDLAEKALAHTIRNQTEAAYHRTDLLEERRPMMEAWAKHVCGAVPND